MKLILLAAAAVIAMPAMAQQSGSTGTNSPTSDGGKGTAVDSAVPNNTQGTMSTDPSTTTPAPQTDSMSQGSMSQQMPQSSTMPAQTTGGDPVGGYQPSNPAMSGPMQPGATVTYQQAPSPDQAYPAPAPLAKYPVCKPGQFDKCMQGRGSTHSRQVHRRR